jgi:uncharacterized protein (UPF0248 family)
MITIRALLDRIRWDQVFSRGQYVIGYFDRLESRIIQVPLADVRIDPDNRYAVLLTDAAGQERTIPLHRVYRVYRNGELVWERKRRPA